MFKVDDSFAYHIHSTEELRIKTGRERERLLQSIEISHPAGSQTLDRKERKQKGSQRVSKLLRQV